MNCQFDGCDKPAVVHLEKQTGNDQFEQLKVCFEHYKKIPDDRITWAITIPERQPG